MEPDEIERDRLLSVEDEELFKFLKKIRYDQKLTAWKPRLGKKIQNGVFFETILLLENLQCSLKEVLNKATPTQDEYQQAVKNNDQHEIQSIIQFFERLRVDFDLVNYACDHIFSSLVRSFLIFLSSHLDSPFNTVGDAWTQVTFPASDVFKSIEQYLPFLQVTSSEHKDKARTGLVEADQQTDVDTDSNTKADADAQQQAEQDPKLQEKEETDRLALPKSIQNFQRRAEQDKRDILELYGNALSNLSHTVKKNEKIKQAYVQYLSIEFHLLDTEQDWSEKLADRHLGDVFNNLYDEFQGRSDLIMYFVDYDHRVNHVMVMDIILVFKYSRKLEPHRLVQVIEEIIERSIHSEQVRKNVMDLNKTIKRKFKDKPAVGLLHWTEKALYDFKYWLLNCFYYKDQIISLVTKPIFAQNRLGQFGINDRIHSSREQEQSSDKPKGEQVKIPTPESIKKQKPPAIPKTNQIEDVLGAIGKKEVWSNKELPPRVREQLRLLNLLYSEQKKLNGWSDQQVEAINKIEVLMQMVQYSDVPEKPSSEHVAKVVAKPLVHLNLLEKQYLDVFNWIEHLDDQFIQKNQQQLGWRIIKLIEFKRSKTSLPVYKRLVTLNFDLSFYTDIVQQLNDLKKIIMSQGYLVQDTQAMTNTIKNKESAHDYLRQRLKKDVHVCRLQLWHDPIVYGQLNPAFESIDKLRAFSFLLTDFLKNIQRSIKSVGGHLVGYIGSYIALDAPKVDIIFIFENSPEQVDDSRDVETLIKITKYWQDYIVEKEKAIDQNIQRLSKKMLKASEDDHAIPVKDTRSGDKGFPRQYLEYFKQGKLHSKVLPIMESIDPLNHQQLKIYRTSTELKPAFIKNVMDYFRAYPLLLCDEQGYQKVSKNIFLKGRKDYKAREKTDRQDVSDQLNIEDSTQSVIEQTSSPSHDEPELGEQITIDSSSISSSVTEPVPPSPND